MLWVALQALPEPAPAELVDGCTALGWWALQFTPKVARVDDALLLELSASERLWGGRSALLRHIHTADKPVAGVRFARGVTSLIALAQLQLPQLQSEGLSGRARRRTAVDDLPLASLTAARPHLATLQRLGCTHWGQLRALPRGGVARRFGADLLDALDRAYGQAPDSYPWLLLPEQFDATLELGAQVEAAPALLFGARRLFNQLQRWRCLHLRTELQRGIKLLRQQQPGVAVWRFTVGAVQRVKQVGTKAPCHPTPWQSPQLTPARATQPLQRTQMRPRRRQACQRQIVDCCSVPCSAGQAFGLQQLQLCQRNQGGGTARKTDASNRLVRSVNMAQQGRAPAPQTLTG